MKQMRIIYSTVVMTISSLVNLGALMLLIIYIYAVIGINLFANVYMPHNENPRINFMDISNAYLTLLRLTTGEAWGDLLG
jgi:hypothetical protein